jgi:hypothetical protein
MEFLVIWLFVSIEKIAALLAIGGNVFFWSMLSVAGLYVLSFVTSKDKEDFSDNVKKTKRYRVTAQLLAFVGAFMFVTSALLPDKKELAIIIAAGTTYNVITSEPAKQIGSKALQLLQKKLDEALKDELPVAPKIVPKTGDQNA